MRDGTERRPGSVPDDDGDRDGVGFGGFDLHRGIDTDADGRPDTVLTADGADLVVLSDLDGDGLADRAVWIGPDGAVHATGVPRPGPDDPADGDGPVVGHAPAHRTWTALLGHLFGFGP